MKRLLFGSKWFLPILTVAPLFASANGPEPRHTGAPGDAAQGCATRGCHTSAANGGPVNTGGGKIEATFSSGSNYYAGVPVVITVRVTDPTNTRFGFQMTARKASDQARAQAGTFTSPNSRIIVICEDNRTRRTTCPDNAPVEFIEHGEVSTTGVFKFTWTPTSDVSGPVHFYVAGNAVNFNGSEDGGDRVYLANYVLNPPVCTTVVPEITSINSGSDFGNLPNFAAGSWIEIKGRNLASTTRVWQDRDFLDANAPISLDGTRVIINNKDAYVYYVSPTQINVQAPADTVNGSVAVRLSNCMGTAPTFNSQKTARAPGLLAPASFNVGGKQYVVALFQDGTYVGPPGLISGVNFRPAKPGDQVTVYGIGFGDVTPTSITPGLVVSGLNQLATAYNLRLNGVQVTTTYGGLAPGFVGLYQFNFAIPDVPNGDQQLTHTLGGDTSTQSLFLTVQR